MNNKAINEFSEGVIHLDLRSVDNTLLDLLNSSYPTKAEFINC